MSRVASLVEAERKERDREHPALAKAVEREAEQATGE